MNHINSNDLAKDLTKHQYIFIEVLKSMLSNPEIIRLSTRTEGIGLDGIDFESITRKADFVANESLTSFNSKFRI